MLVDLGYSGGCVDVDALDEHFGDAVDGVAEVRRHLEKRGRVRRAALELTEEHIAALGALDEAFGAWTAECMDGTTETLGSSSGTGDAESGTTDSTSAGDDPCTDDAQCTARDPAKPFCDSDGMCVACVETDTTICDQQLLICDVDAGACVPCTAHEQCEARACDLQAVTPTCFEPENVLDVGAGQSYTSIGFALATVDSMMLDRAVLRLHDGTSFNEGVTINAATIAIVAAPGDEPQWIKTSMVKIPTLRVAGTETQVYLDQVRLVQNINSHGIICDGGSVDMRRSHVVQNGGGGITATNGCALHVHNSFVEGAGSGAGRAALVVSESSATLTYSTFFNSAFAESLAIECTGTSTATLRNSIVATQGGRPGTELACPMINISHTVTEAPVLGKSNFNTGTFPDTTSEDWFVDVLSGDFHLQNDALNLFADVAEWQTGDPVTDLDGDPRPSTNNAPDYPGADVP